MRASIIVLSVCLGAGTAFGAEKPADKEKPIVPCSTEAGSCDAAPKNLRRASDAYWRGFKAKDKNHELAFREFSEAVELVPGNVDYVAARELARTTLVHDHIQAGNSLLADGLQVRAVAEFRAALALDSADQFAKQRLMDALGDNAPKLTPGLRLAASSNPVDLQPKPGRQDFHFRGDSRGLYETIARAFGLKVTFDDSFTGRPVRFDVEQIDFYRATKLAAMVSKGFYVPLSEDELMVAADTAENRKQFERMALRSFYPSAVSSPQELNDIVSLLRGVFDIRLISSSPDKNTITIRAPRELLDAATEFLEQLSNGPPQVMLDVQVFEIDHMLLRNLGVNMPLQFQMFSLEAVSGLLGGSSSIQSLINQLIATGGINQANTTAVSALLAQLAQQQQSNLSPLLTHPFFTFGGGVTRFAVTVPSATVTAQLNTSTVKSLDHMTLRAMQGRAATMKIGTRFPILNATFAPLYNSSAISQNIQNNTFSAAFPSISYEDLGISLKATPGIHSDTDVTLELETEIKALTGQSFNGVPVISNRSYKSTITVKNGETAIVVGDISRTEQVSLSGTPWFGDVPAVGLLLATQNKTIEDNELLVVITPHIMDVAHEEPRAFWLPSSR